MSTMGDESALGQGADQLSEGGSGLGKAGSGLSKSAPGLTPLWQSPEWDQACAWNDEGSQLVDRPDFEAGLTLLSRAARFGLPWALASFTWRCLLDGQFARGLAEYDAAYDACAALPARLAGHNFLASTARVQVANVRSNAALLMIASGAPLDQAREIWDADADSGNVESLFYPAMVADRQGDAGAADAIVRGLPTATWLQLRDILGEHADDEHWFGQWCQSGLVLLERNAPDLTEPNLGTLDAAQVQDRPLAYAQTVADGLWDAVGRATAQDRTAEVDLRRFAEDPSATGWIAKSELGCLLISDDHDKDRVELGRQLLVTCLDCPYRDITATSAWNLAELYRIEGRRGLADELARFSVDLGDGTALVVTARRMIENGEEHQAQELLERAVRDLPRGDTNRATARALWALLDTVSLPPKVAQWFTDHQGTLAPSDWSRVITAALWAGDFNVDVARAAISTRYFEDCPAECYFEPAPYECGDCGRSPHTFLSAASGKGDGGYLAFKLFGDGGDHTNGGVETPFDNVGMFTAFLPSDIEGLQTIVPGAHLLDVVASSAPLVLGTLRSSGELIVADSSKSRDDTDVAVRLEVPAGDYVVVCFLRPDIDPATTLAARLGSTSLSGDPLTCVALAAIRGPLADLLLASPAHVDAATRDDLLTDLWGDGSRTVHALVADIRPQLLERMVEAGGGVQEADSFVLQLAERADDGQDAVFALRQSGRTGSAETLDLLQQRGFVEPDLPWWQDHLAQTPGDIWLPVLQARQGPLPRLDCDAAPSVWARRVLARRADLPAEALDALRADADDRVRVNLARNPHLPPAVLASLAHDPDPGVRSAVAANPQTPVEVLPGLAAAIPSPKGALARNDNTPGHLLASVAGGATVDTRRAVAERSDLPADLASHLSTDASEVRKALAANPAVPGAVLTALAADLDSWVRAKVAANPSTPPPALMQLSLDEDEFVRNAVLRNPTTPDEAKAQASLLGATPPSPSPSTSTTANSHPRFCDQCGTPVAPHHLFCSGCGQPLVAPPRDGAADAWRSLQSEWPIRGSFNVEGGSAGVGTRIFDWCDCAGQPHDGSFCAACGRGAGNCVAVTAGAGDGVYPAFRLTDTAQTPTGMLTVFEQSWAEELEAGTRSPSDLSRHARPVYAGHLTVDGLVYVHDATAGWDGSHALVDVELPPGRYEVIAWQAEMDILKERGMEPYVRQIALGVYSPALLEALEALIPIDRREGSRQAMNASVDPLTPVLAHIEPRWADACMYNAREDDERGEQDRALSWLLQAALHGHEPALQALPPGFLESTASLDVARRSRLLLMRGQRPDGGGQIPATAGLSSPSSDRSVVPSLTKASPGLTITAPLAPSPESTPITAADLIERAMSPVVSVRDQARHEIIDAVDVQAMLTCADRAHEQGDLSDEEFWWLEISTAPAPAGDDDITRGVMGLCERVLVPHRRYHEAELYCRHLLTRPTPTAQDQALAMLDAVASARSADPAPAFVSSTAWQRVDLSQPAPVTADQQAHYDRLYAYLQARADGESMRDLLESSRADFLPKLTGWIGGFAASPEVTRTGIARDTIAGVLGNWLLMHHCPQLAGPTSPTPSGPPARPRQL